MVVIPVERSGEEAEAPSAFQCRRLPLVLNVKMRRLVIGEEHPDDDPKKS